MEKKLGSQKHKMVILAVRHETFEVEAGVLSFTSALSCIYSSALLDFGIQLVPYDTDNQDGRRGVVSCIQGHPRHALQDGGFSGAASGGSLDSDVFHPASHLYQQ